jgi:hypothetical protein
MNNYMTSYAVVKLQLRLSITLSIAINMCLKTKSEILNWNSAIPVKDLCAIKKKGCWDIDFYVRGTSYDSVSDLWDHLGSEKHVFILCCKGLNLEFIPPTID